jgi:hypothetical protein
MSETIEVQTAELTDKALDWALADALDFHAQILNDCAVTHLAVSMSLIKKNASMRLKPTAPPNPTQPRAGGARIM